MKVLWLELRFYKRVVPYADFSSFGALMNLLNNIPDSWFQKPATETVKVYVTGEFVAEMQRIHGQQIFTVCVRRIQDGFLIGLLEPAVPLINTGPLGGVGEAEDPNAPLPPGVLPGDEGDGVYSPTEIPTVGMTRGERVEAARSGGQVAATEHLTSSESSG